MDGMIYLVTSAAVNIFHEQSMHANNLANINTNAFKADLMQLTSLPVTQGSFSTRVYSQMMPGRTDFSPGELMETGHNLDAAIQNEGWFAVQTLDGKEAYTRKGNFRLSAEGILIGENNLPVVGEGGPITLPPFKKLDIGTDGTISVVPLESKDAVPAIVGKLKLVNPPEDSLEKGIDGLVRTKDSNSADVDPSVKVLSGFLETSNVNAINEMTTIISLAREFEMQMKMIGVAEENEKKATTILAV